MATCGLSIKALRSLNKIVIKDLKELSEAGGTFDLKKYMRSIYDIVLNATEDTSLALDAARVVPKFVAITAFNITDVRKLKGLTPNELGEALDTLLEQELEATAEFIGLAEESDTKKKMKAHNNAKEHAKKKAAKDSQDQVKDVDLDKAGTIYKPGAQVEITKGNSKGEVWTVKEDNGDRITLEKDDVTKTMSKKSIKPANNEAIPEKNHLQLLLEQLQNDLTIEENSEFRSEAAVQQLKDAIEQAKVAIAEQTGRDTEFTAEYRPNRNTASYLEVEDRLANGEVVTGKILSPQEARGYEAADHSSGTMYVRDNKTGIVMKVYFKNMSGMIPNAGESVYFELILPVEGEPNVIMDNGVPKFEFKGEIYPSVIKVKSDNGQYSGNLAFTNSEDFGKAKDTVEEKVTEDTARYRVYRIEPGLGDADWAFSNELSDVEEYIGNSQYRVIDTTTNQELTSKPETEEEPVTEQNAQFVVYLQRMNGLEVVLATNNESDIQRFINDDWYLVRDYKNLTDIGPFKSSQQRREESLEKERKKIARRRAREKELTYTREDVEGMIQEIQQKEQEIAETEMKMSDPTYIETDIYAFVAHNFEPVSPESAESETGGKVGRGKDIHPYMVSKGGPSIEALAENFMEYAVENGGNLNATEDELRNVIIEFVQSGKTPKQTLKDFTGQTELSRLKKEVKDLTKLLNRIQKRKPGLFADPASDPTLDPVPTSTTGTVQTVVKPQAPPLNRVEPAEKINAVKESDGLFTANAPTLLATHDREAPYIKPGEKTVADERIPYEEKLALYAIQRNILNKIGKDGNNSGTDITIGEYNGIYLTAMHMDNPAIAGEIGVDRDPDRLGVFLVVTDRNGNPIPFHKTTGNPTSLTNPARMFAIYPMQATKQAAIGGAKVKKAAQALGRSRGESTESLNDPQVLAKYEQIIYKEAAELNKIKEHLTENKDDSTMRLSIMGGSMGYIETSNRTRTSLKLINTDGMKISISKKGIGLIHYPHGKSDELYGSRLELERPTVKQSGYAELIKQLLFDDLRNEFNAILGYDKREAYVELFIPTYKQGKGKAPFVQMFKTVEDGKFVNDGNFGEYTIILAPLDAESEPLYLYPEDFTNPEKIAAAKAHFDQLVEKTRPQDGSYNQFKMQVNKPSIESSMVEIPVIEDGIITGTKTQNYVDFVKETGFQVNTQDVAADGKLRRTNSYFMFGIDPEIMNQEVTEEAAEINDGTVEDKTSDGKSVSDIQQDMTNDKLDEGDDTFDDNDYLDVPFTRVDVKQKSLKATKKQIEEAEKWWNSSPLSKHIPFKAMFETVNSKAVAQWTTDGIVLFQGSDYSDLYHEAFHGFTQAFLTKKQKKDLYNEVRKKTGSFKNYKGEYVTFKKASDLEVEEYLAEQFREYMLKGQKPTKGSPKQNSFFRRIWNALKALFTGNTTKSAILNDHVDKKIKDLYEKLRVGDLSEYSYDVRNAQFGTLNSGIISSKKDVQEGELTTLNYQNSKTVNDLVDYYITDFIDAKNSNLTTDQIKRRNELQLELQDQKLSPKDRTDKQAELDALTDKKTYEFTGLVTKNKKMQQVAYSFALSRINALKNETARKYNNETNPTLKARYRNDYFMLKFAVDNFGDVTNLESNKIEAGEDIDNVIAYHNAKSKIFEESFRLEYEDVSEDKAFLGFDRKGNEQSLKALAKSEIIYLLKTLPKYTKVDGKYELSLNRLGIPELNDFQATWNRLARGLENSQNFDDMYRRLNNIGKKYPAVAELINRMGDPYNGSTSKDEHSLWTNFWQTFNKARVPLVQLTVHEKTLYEKSGTTEFMSSETSANVGEAINADRAVARRWQNNLNETLPDSSDPNNFVLRDREGSYLNTGKIIQKYSSIEDVEADPMGFYKAIGFDFTDTEEIYEALHNPDLANRYTPQYFYQQLLVEDREGNQVRDINLFVKKANQQNRFKALLALEASYSDHASNFMVSNAEGNTQFEHTLNNTMTMMVSAINNATDYDALMAMPHMQHLNVETNPFAAASIWLKSIFDLDPTSPNYKKKRLKNGQPAKLKLTNLSGVLYQQTITKDGISNTDSGNGVASASADEFSKLILDLHLNYAGVPELMRHADKGTSFSISVDGVIDGNSSVGDNYIPIQSFGSDTYMSSAYYKIAPHIVAEIIRSNKLLQYKKDNIKNYDHGYIDRIAGENGMFFYQFDLMLTPKVKEKLQEKTEGLTDQAKVEEVVNSMKIDIYNDINSYFTQQYEQISTKFNEAEFIGGNIMKEMTTQKGLTEANAKEAFVKSYVYNSFIHNLESLAILYGDLAQFNYLKEEFHKRNAGIGSTGTILRTDKVMQNFINDSMWDNSYAGSLGYQQHLFDGTAKTAIVEDMSIDSVYTEEYRKALEKDNNGKAADGYNGQTEGDAQGLITFDAYRQFKYAEGTWSDPQEKLYQAIVKGEKTDEAKVAKFFPVIKGQYWGPLKVEKGLLPVTAMHKYSLFPLIPSVTKGKKVDAVHKKMLQEGISYVTFESGSKVGNITKDGTFDKLYSDQKNRTLSEGIANEEGQVTNYDADNAYFTPNVIYLEFFKNQLEIHDERKGKVVFSTQLRKLIQDGLFQNGVPTDFTTGKTKEERILAWEALSEKEREKASDNYKLAKVYESNLTKLTEFAKQELLDQIGWTQRKREDGTIELKGDMDSLLKLVKDELTRQDLGDHGIDYIQVSADGSIKHDLSGHFAVEKLEKVLNALMVKKLVKQKVNGEGLIQVANTLFEDMIAAEDVNFDNPTEDHLAKYGSDDLPTYREGKGPNGTTVAMKVKVALAGDFRKLLDLKDLDGKKIKTLKRLNELIKDDNWLNTGENRKLITMVGVRIPVQGMNSMEFMEVYEFLPEEAGSIIIPPTEIVTKSGADFDVDKMTVMMPNIANFNGKVELVKERRKPVQSKEQITERLNELYAERKASREKYDAIFNEEDITKRLGLSEKHAAEYNAMTEEIAEMYEKVKKQKAKKSKLFEKYSGKKLKKQVAKEGVILNKMYDDMHEIEDRRKQFLKDNSTVDFKQVIKEQQEESAELNTEIENLQRDIQALTSKSIENDLIGNIVDILSLPSNFNSLITPNSTELLDEYAGRGEKGMAEFATDYNQYELSHGDETVRKNAKGKSAISPAKALEIGYNLNKHSVNSIGKDVLGIGAVDNTYNTLFNRIGAYLNPTYKNYTREQYDAALDTEFEKRTEEQIDIISSYKRNTILLPHNKRKVQVADGSFKDAIDLSDNLAHDKNKIADIVNQMINGWVDIAKDAWIFNIQGNKEVGPTLLFLIQAGVPLEQAIYFVSNPLIRQYVREQKKAKSTFARALGIGSGNPNFAANDAKRAILSNPAFGFRTGDRPVTSATLEGRKLNTYIKESILALENSGEFDPKLLKEKARQPLTNAQIDSFDKAVFMHFLQLEELTGAVRDVKMRTNVDTTRDASLFAAQDRLGMLSELRDSGIVPEVLIDRIEGLQKDKGYNTPISSFFIQQFQIDLLGDAFPLRNNDTLNRFSRRAISKAVSDETYGNKEKAVASFKSDLVSFLFQNELRYFNLDSYSEYLGYPIKTEAGATQYGALVKDGVLYVDKRVLEAQISIGEGGSFAINRLPKGVAKVDASMFSNEQEYYHFVIMREILRDQNPIQKLLNSGKFKGKVDYVASFLARKEGQSKEEYTKAIVQKAYEVYLRDEALHRTFNHGGLFHGDATFADEFLRIRTSYKQLVDEFPGLLNRLTLSTHASGMKNISLTTSELEGDEINIMTESLLRLQDRAEVGAILPEATSLEIDEITQFFKDFEVYAFLQGGLNMKGAFALNQFVPQVRENGQASKVLQILEKPMKDIVEFLSDSKDPNVEQYLSTFFERWRAENAGTNRSLRTRGKNYTENITLEDKSTIGLVNEKVIQDADFVRQYSELYHVDGVSEKLNPNEWSAVNRVTIGLGSTPNKFERELYNELLDNLTDDNFVEIDLPARVQKEFVKKLEAKGFVNVEGSNMLYTKGGVSKTELYMQYTGRTLESVTESNTYPTDIAMFQLAPIYANNNQNAIFVYNLASEDTTNAKGGDRFLHGKGPMVFGLPTIKAYNQPPGGERLDLYRDVDGKIDPKLKELIDEAIEDLVKKQTQEGKKIMFNKDGYGQEMLEKDKNGNMFSPQAFVYLSSQLLDNFGYINPGFLRTGTGKNMLQQEFIKQGQTFTDVMIQESREQEVKELSDDYVKEMMKYCIIK
jgi:hypothetical protein